MSPIFMEILMLASCPNCGQSWESRHDLSKHEGATADCPCCGQLLLVKDGVFVDFHQHLYESDPSWPKDGKGTGFVEVSSENDL